MSPLRINISTQGVYKDNETSSGLLRQMGIRLVIYLDDLLIMHHSKAELLQFLSLICQLFKALDLMVNLEKSQMVPKQEMEFLGFQINSASFQLVFQSRKCRKSSRIPATSFGLCERPSKVCQENDSCNESYLASPSAVRNPAENYQFSRPNRPTLASQGKQIQHSTPNPGYREGIILMDIPGLEPHDDISSYSGYDHQV